MTTAEANEFFASRTEEVIGEDTDPEAKTEHIKSVHDDRRTRGRIVVTLRYEIPRDEWAQFETDGVDVLRREVDLIHNRGALNKHQFGDMMADLFDGVVGWDIEATK